MYNVYLLNKWWEIEGQILNVPSFSFSEKLSGKWVWEFGVDLLGDYANSEWLYDYRKIKVTKQLDGWIEKLICYGVIVWVEGGLKEVEVHFNDLMGFLDVQIIDADKSFTDKKVKTIVGEVWDDMNDIDWSGLELECDVDDIIDGEIVFDAGASIFSILWDLVGGWYVFKFDGTKLIFGSDIGVDRSIDDDSFLEYRSDVNSAWKTNISKVSIESDGKNVATKVLVKKDGVVNVSQDEDSVGFNEKDWSKLVENGWINDSGLDDYLVSGKVYTHLVNLWEWDDIDVKSLGFNRWGLGYVPGYCYESDGSGKITVPVVSGMDSRKKQTMFFYVRWDGGEWYLW